MQTSGPKMRMALAIWLALAPMPVMSQTPRKALPPKNAPATTLQSFPAKCGCPDKPFVPITVKAATKEAAALQAQKICKTAIYPPSKCPAAAETTRNTSEEVGDFAKLRGDGWIYLRCEIARVYRASGSYDKAGNTQYFEIGSRPVVHFAFQEGNYSRNGVGIWNQKTQVFNFLTTYAEGKEIITIDNNILKYYSKGGFKGRYAEDTNIYTVEINRNTGDFSDTDESTWRLEGLSRVSYNNTVRAQYGRCTSGMPRRAVKKF